MFKKRKGVIDASSINSNSLHIPGNDGDRWFTTGGDEFTADGRGAESLPGLPGHSPAFQGFPAHDFVQHAPYPGFVSGG